MSPADRPDLEARVRDLAGSLDRVERRLADLERRIAGGGTAAGIDGPHPEGGPPAPRAGMGRVSGLALLSLLGRLFLVLGGAYFLRAVTDGGLVPRAAGTALGLAYAGFWVFLADREAGRDRRLAATFSGVSAVLIAYPILWEMTSRHEHLGAPSAAALLALFTTAVLAASWRRRLRAVAWFAVLAAGAAAIALLLSTWAFGLFSGLILLLGGATIWLAYLRGCRGLEWLFAGVTNLFVLALVLVVTTPRGAQPPFDALTAGTAQAISAGLLLVYLGSFAVHALIQREEVGMFETLQSLGALVIGFGGAVRIASTAGGRPALLGAAALLAGAASYAVGFAFVRRRIGRGRNFLLYTSLAIALVLAGSVLVVGVRAAAVGWGALALGAAGLGGRFNRVTLRAHSAIYGGAAAVSAGLVRGAFRAFTAPPARWPAPPTGTALVVIFLVAASYGVLVATRKYRNCPQLARIPRLVLLLVLVSGLAGVLVNGAGLWLGAGGAAAAAPIAALRTAVIAGAAVLLAGARRWWSLEETTPLVYPLLAVGGVKLFVEDLQRGVPSTLFIAFVAYGAALILAPRLLHVRREPGEEAGG
ncbi:MAG: hypothetical protein ABIK65_05300 [Candidatus Eisenbacteria bacterium]